MINECDGIDELPEGWHSTGILAPEEALPEDETPVLLLFWNGKRRIGELRWESPGHEDTFQAYRYWDDPENDGQDWDWADIVGWRELP